MKLPISKLIMASAVLLSACQTPEREQRRDHRQKPSQSRKRNHDSGSHVHSWARRGYRNISG